MNAHDRIKYFSVVSKVNQGDFSSLNSEEVQWLQDHPDVISILKMSDTEERYFVSVLVNKILWKRFCFY